MSPVSSISYRQQIVGRINIKHSGMCVHMDVRYSVRCSAVQSLEARVHLFMDTLPCTFIHAHQKYHHHHPCFLILNMLTWTFAFGWYLHHVPNSKLLAYNLKPKHTNLKQHTRNKPALPNDSCEFGQIYTHCCHFIYIFLL